MPPPLTDLLEQVRHRIIRGDLAQAGAELEGALLENPASAEAHHLLGAVRFRQGMLEEAVASFGRAIGLQPQVPAFHTNLGLALQGLSRHEQALACHDASLRLRPGYAEGHHNRATALQALGRLEHALAAYDQALLLKPAFADALNNRGNVLALLGRPQEAQQSYTAALAIEPRSANAHYNLSATLRTLGRPDEAAMALEQALEFNPLKVEAWQALAQAQQDLGRWAKALESQRRALDLRPGDVSLMNGMGALLHARRDLEAALAAFNEALAVDPRYAPAHNNRGATLRELGRWPEALESFDRALALKPEYADALHNRGNVLRDLGRPSEALDCFRAALKVEPGFEFLEGAVVHTRAQVCDWVGLKQEVDRLLEGVEQGRCVTVPFPVLALTDDPALQRQAAEVYVTRRLQGGVAAAAAPRIKVAGTDPGGRIRVGYFSADFHAHATMRLMAQLFECHDRQRFEILAFSFGPESNDAMRGRLRAAVDRFEDVRHLDDQGVADLSWQLGLDIAVDLKGHTREGRPGIFTRRCAPVQISYLGYPGTSGCTAMDYLVADDFLIPPHCREHYGEKVIYMPGCYQVNDGRREVPPLLLSREHCGLPEKAFVFCCFNNSYKILPDIFERWARILQQVPGSVMWLLEDNATAVVNLRRAAVDRGLDPDRLVFAPRAPAAEHLARHRLADLFLDTFPCGAHTTASDALWMGLPVLALAGRSFASRVAGSLLNALGLNELITTDLAAYERTAVNLARDCARLDALKSRLAAEVGRNRLFDAQQFAVALESAYVAVHKRDLAGQGPADMVLHAPGHGQTGERRSAYQ